MMNGQFRELNWKDIEQLIYAECGLKTEEEQRTCGEMWFCGALQPPKDLADTVIRVQVYEKPFSERSQEHAGNSN